MVNPLLKQDDFTESSSSPLPMQQNIGLLFSEARKALYLSLDDIAQKTRIQKSYLEAIEKEEFEKIPSPIYLAGFIRLYARHVQLDGDEMVRRLNLRYVPEPIEYKPYVVAIPKEPSHLLTYVSFAIAMLFGGIVYFFHSSEVPKEKESLLVTKVQEKLEKDSQDLIKSDNEINAAIAASQQNVSQESVLTQSTPNQSSEEHLTFKEEQQTNNLVQNENKEVVKIQAADDCWVEIRKSDSIVTSRILKAGDVIELTSAKDYFLTLGNAGGVNVFLKGQQLKRFGEKGQVIRDIDLSKLP